MASPISMPTIGALPKTYSGSKSTQDPFTAMGGGVQLPNGSWVPRDHPEAIAHLGGGTGLSGTATPDTSSIDPFVGSAAGSGVHLANGDWVPANHPSASGPRWGESTTPATPGTPSVTPSGGIPAPTTGIGPGTTAPLRDESTTYTPGTVTQFTAPDQSATQGAAMTLLNQILANPHSITETGLGMTLEKGKEAALAKESEAMELMKKSLASTGMMDSGLTQTYGRRIGEATQGELLKNLREGYLTKMMQDRADELAALGAAEAGMTGQVGRATNLYNTGLSGQLAQEGINQAGAESALQGHLADQSAWNMANTNQNDIETLALQQLLGQGSLDLDWARLAELGRQFDLTNPLNWASVLMNSSNNLGNQQFNWSSLLSGLNSSLFGDLV